MKGFIYMQTKNTFPGRELARSANSAKGAFPLRLFGDWSLAFESHARVYLCAGSLLRRAYPQFKEKVKVKHYLDRPIQALRNLGG
jgi:hypothetical protein